VRRTKGLTVIEVLIALTLLGILVSAIVSPIISSFQLARTNRLSLDATSEAQRIIETIKGQWQSPSRYDANCAVISLTSNQTVTLAAVNSDGSANATALTFTSSGCTTSTSPGTSACPATQPALKRVSVRVVDLNNTAKVLSTISFDVVCPRR
jgi:prepilin-type N-terminal cleavage/methylation domain-containing protein